MLPRALSDLALLWDYLNYIFTKYFLDLTGLQQLAELTVTVTPQRFSTRDSSEDFENFFKRRREIPFVHTTTSRFPSHSPNRLAIFEYNGEKVASDKSAHDPSTRAFLPADR